METNEVSKIAEHGNMFDYDLWANRQWMACLESKGRAEPDWSIFQHILAAQEIWAARCNGTSPTEMPTPEICDESLAELSATWKSLIDRLVDDPLIDYRRTTGQALRMPFSCICRHVIDHGAYHRGDLRGLCRTRNDEDFPETGYGGFVFDSGRGFVLED
jgi:uncharacterized damage-inducible protein DinB